MMLSERHSPRMVLHVPIEPALLASEARMAKRSLNRVCDGLVGRRERPARWHGQPRRISRDLAT